MSKIYIICALLLLSVASRSATNEEGRASIDESKKLAEGQASLVAQEMKQKKVLAAVYELNRKLKKLEEERSRFSQEQQQLEVNIKYLEEKIAEIEHKTAQQKALLTERLRAIYKFGGGRVAQLIFSSGSASQLERNLRILGIVASRDKDLIRDFKSNRIEILRKKQKLAGRLNYLKSLNEKIERKEASMLDDQKTKARLLERIKKSKLFAEVELQRLKEKARNGSEDDSGALDLLYRESFAEMKGQLPPPAKGPVIQRYGIQKFPDRQYTVSNKGVTLGAPLGSAVAAVFAGQLIFKGQLPGFGQTLVIDHGDHYYTIYGFISEAKVEIGDEVKMGQVIATVGKGEEGVLQNISAGLYFEVRHFSEPYDPLKWVKGIN